uniref:Uncharacterized protein n=1 Tax=Rhizochromulina marina TaxID=1034831 RepID=A0A7S2SS40_9STRA
MPQACEPTRAGSWHPGSGLAVPAAGGLGEGDENRSPPLPNGAPAISSSRGNGLPTGSGSADAFQYTCPASAPGTTAGISDEQRGGSSAIISKPGPAPTHRVHHPPQNGSLFEEGLLDEMTDADLAEIEAAEAVHHQRQLEQEQQKRQRTA